VGGSKELKPVKGQPGCNKGGPPTKILGEKNGGRTHNGGTTGASQQQEYGNI